jgi:signal transduction histidine kinase
MNQMIQDLLDVSRIQAGLFSIAGEFGAHEVRALVGKAIELQEPLAEGKGQDLQMDVAGDLAPVMVNHDRLLQVFQNLIGNAIKFTPEGGTIRISARCFQDDVQFSVSDTGPGIPEDQIPHVFDRFWQAKESAQLGTGLGLTIAKAIVEAHGGRIWVRSQRTGTTFYFTAPLANERARAEVPARMGA